MRTLFMGTPDFAVPSLKKLIRESVEMVGVFTQPDRPVGRSQHPVAPPVKRLALENRLPVFSPEKIKNEETRRLVQDLQPEVIVVVAYGKILPPWMLTIPRHGAINAHASLLPKYRGAAPIQWAIASGETVTGMTIMQMDAGLDTGDILLQREIPITPADTAQSLHDRLSLLAADLIWNTLNEMKAARLHPRKQDDAFATLAPILKKDDGRIDWNWPAEKIHNHVRGFNPWPGTSTSFRGKLLRVWKTEIAPAKPTEVTQASTELPGTLSSCDAHPLAVCTGAGNRLELLEVQLEGHRRMSGNDFHNGFRIHPGERLV